MRDSRREPILLLESNKNRPKITLSGDARFRKRVYDALVRTGAILEKAEAIQKKQKLYSEKPKCKGEALYGYRVKVSQAAG